MDVSHAFGLFAIRLDTCNVIHGANKEQTTLTALTLGLLGLGLLDLLNVGFIRVSAHAG